jgi:hypothetical protein
MALASGRLELPLKIFTMFSVSVELASKKQKATHNGGRKRRQESNNRQLGRKSNLPLRSASPSFRRKEAPQILIAEFQATRKVRRGAVKSGE